MNTHIPYARQSITDDDINEVVAALRSKNLTQGPKIEEFEQAIATFVGAKYAVATSSATAALHIACRAADLQKGDYHWTSPNSFVASANCGLYCGSMADFVDVDVSTGNMSVAAFEQKLAQAKKSGKIPKVVIPVAFGGQSSQMDRLYPAAKEYGITVIEDASHGIGGCYKGRPLGSGQFADMTVFSFHPVKILTTGEGGLIVTNDQKLYDRLVLFRSHGITRNPELLQGQPDGPWYYEQIELGFNYRLTDIQAALGISQMRRLKLFTDRRQHLVDRYQKELQGLPITLPAQAADQKPAWHLFWIKLNLNEIQKTKNEIYSQLLARGIQTNVHYIPIHTQPYYKKLGFKHGDFLGAEEHYARSLSIPLYYELSDVEQDRVIASIRGCLG